MTLGEKLLSLTVEYQQSMVARSGWGDVFDGEASGREPAVIAAEYEEALLELLARK